MRETGRGGVMEQVRLHLGQKPDLLLFRNQAGFIDECPTCKRNAQRYGLAPGAGDLIGIGPGGRFASLEVKATGKQPTPEQVQFMKLVWKFGGLASWCDSVESAEEFYRGLRILV